MKVNDAPPVAKESVLEFNDEEILRRKAFLEFDESDAARLHHVHATLQRHADDFAGSLCAHLNAFEETRLLLGGAEVISRMQKTQSNYFQEITEAKYGRDYFERRQQAGLNHQRIGLAPEWYLGIYGKYLSLLLPTIRQHFGDDTESFSATMNALIKAILLDMSLTIGAYIQTRDQTILGLRNYAELVFDSMNDSIIVLSPELRIESCNRCCAEMLGADSQDLLEQPLAAVLQADGLDAAIRAVLHGAPALSNQIFTLRLAHDGSRHKARITLKRVCVGEELGRALLVVERISEDECARLEAEDRLARSEALLRQAQAVARIGSWRIEPSGPDPDALEWSAETYRLFGVPPDTRMTYGDFLDRIHADDRERVVAAFQDALRGQAYQVEHRIEVDGQTRWLEERAELRRNADGSVLWMIGTVQDISERKRAEHHIEKLAFYDTLTALPNRTHFQDQLKKRLALARSKGQPLALLFIDLDRFKEINDTQGHLSGDKVLAEVARRFRSSLRQGELLARLGGDEFVVIADEADRNGAGAIALRLLATLRTPISVRESSFQLGASIGIAVYPDDAHSVQNLLKYADIAMFRAKSMGGGHCFYSHDMGEKLSRNLELVQRFSQALRNNGLQLYYQPKVTLCDGKLTGVEALLRWHDPEWGWVPPTEFLPIIEERGMMAELGEWVLAEACRQLRAWEDAGLALPPRVAINVAAPQIDDKNFPARTLTIIEQAGLSPTRFELELTESSMMRDPQCAMEVTQALVDAGFTLAIDDFGTGYSSLAYLQRFPAHTLKIDRSFVNGLLADGNNAGIVRTIIAMAQSLGLTSLAEGVEDAQQAESLRALGCLEAQGYHFARPMPADALGKTWLA